MTPSTIERIESGELAGGVIDRDAVARLSRFGGPRLLEQMIDLFMITGRERLDAAHEAALAGNCAGVERALHALKSSAGQMGALTLQELCAHGESLAVQGVAGALPALVAAAYEQYIAAIRLLQFLRPGGNAQADPIEG